MDVSLTPDLERFIAEKVEAGAYDSPSAMVLEGLQLLFKAEEERVGARRQMDAMIQVGLDQIDRGETVDWTVARDRILSSLNTEAKRSAASSQPMLTVISEDYSSGLRTTAKERPTT